MVVKAVRGVGMRENGKNQQYQILFENAILKTNTVYAR